jgi:hypothetical protein
VHCVRDNEILLIDPNGDEADRVTWGDGGGNEVTTGTSLERTLAWLGRYRRLSKDYERCTKSSEGMIFVASITTMLRRLSTAH